MSNQFSYELDERQIRIMLQDGELECDQLAWNRFEQSAQPDVKPKPGSHGPRFNLSVSRSVIVPVIFVVLIGGLSAMLFSFVDFKKKDVPVTKNILEPTVQTAPATTPTKAETAPAKKETPAGMEHQEQAAIAATPSVTTTPPTVVQKDMSSQALSGSVPEKKTVSTPEVKQAETPAAKNNTTILATGTKQNTQTQPVLRKRKVKVTEEIPTINTSSTILNQESKEPELELK